MPVCHAREAVELGAVAMERDDQGPVGDGAGIGVAPKSEAATAEFAYDELGALFLAIRRKHGSGIETASVHERYGRTLAQRHPMPAPRQRERLPEADDSGAANGDFTRLGH